jgi:hypothetical protein
MTTSTQFRNILKAFAVVPLATAGVMASTAIAEAAALNGGFQIGSFASTITLDNTGLDFINPLTDPLAEIDVAGQTGGFDAYESAFIKDLVFGESITSFLDFSVGAPSPLAFNTADDEVTFDLLEQGDLVATMDSNVPGAINLTLGFKGNFISDTQEVTAGRGTLTFQVADSKYNVSNGVQLFQNDLAGGTVFEGVTFSGAAFTTDVPEPATLLGLLGVGALGAAARKSKKEAES